MSGKAMKTGLMVAVGVGVVAVVGLLVVSPSGTGLLGFGKKKIDSSQFVLEYAKRSPYRVTVTERGTVDSQQNDVLVNTVEGTTVILEIVPEGSKVKAPLKAPADCEIVEVSEDRDSPGTPFATVKIKDSDGNEQTLTHDLGQFTRILVNPGQLVKNADLLVGDVVCELDSAAMVEKEKQQQIKVTQAEADLEKARKNVEIQENQNQSDEAAARLKMELADLDLTKFEDGDYVAQVNELAGQIKNLQQQLAASQDELEFNQRNAKKGYVQLSKLEQSRLSVLKTQIELDVAETKLKVLKQYEYKRQIAELQANAEEFERELERTKLTGDAALSQLKAAEQAAELTYTLEVDQLERLQRQIKGCTLVARSDGEVVYANQQSRRSEPVVIEEGVQVRERQAIIQLPDLTKMKVDARVHESKISNVRVGNAVVVTIDAYPDRPIRGRVDYVSSIASPGSWPNTDLKEYAATVVITEEEALAELDLKPGLTAGIEIITKETSEPRLQVPVQSVVGILDRFYAYKFGDDGPELVELLVVSSNDQMIQVAEFSQFEDGNKDGKLSPEELRGAFSTATFMRADADEDGAISEAEFRAFNGIVEGDAVIMNPRTHFADELEELESTLSAEREANRQSGNVEVTPVGEAGEESGTTGRPSAGENGGRASQGREGQPGGGQPGGGQPGGGQGGGVAGAGQGGGGERQSRPPEETFKEWDSNGDGKLVPGEGPSFLANAFSRFDADGNGEITLEEFKEARRNAPQGGGRGPSPGSGGGGRGQ